ncbi:MAG: HAD-IA family hydrolase [Sphingomonas bacterium]
MQLPALLFDLDGTLIDSACDIARALSMIREDRGGMPIDPSSVRRLVSHGVDMVVCEGLGAYCRDVAADVVIFREVLRGLAPDPATIYPGVVDALTGFATAGHRMAIVTNKPEALSRGLLDALGLARYFGAIVGGDTTPCPKPDPTPLRLALAAINVGADAAMLIGDSDVDAAAAKACGVPFLLYEAGYGAEACLPGDVHARFAHFGELDALITAFAGAARTTSTRLSKGC